MKIALCLLARLENKYIREYVEYYEKLGFDNIIIYDNNRPEEEDFHDEIGDYIDNGYVKIVKWPVFNGNSQHSSYNDCYYKFKDQYDWIAFFDADEYFVPCKCNTIKEFLLNDLYKDFGAVAIPMKNFDDNDILVNNTKTRLDKYTRQCKNDVWRYYKSIVKCNNDIDFFSDISDSAHLPYIETSKICDADGKVIPWNFYQCKKDIENAYLKHIPTGCIDDFINGKDLRKWPDTNSTIQFGLGYFSIYNDLTKEKIDYYDKFKKSE